MEYRIMENIGVETSILGFGCMRFPTDEKGNIREAEATAMLDKAYAGGVRYYDSAWPYHGGQSEGFVGKAMEKYPRDSFLFATKMPCWDVKEPADAEHIFNEQLKRLRTDYIDFYLLHALGRDRWHKIVELGVVDFCKKMKAEGKIKHLGFSFHDDFSAFKEIIEAEKWDFCQIQLNYMDYQTQATMEGYYLAEKLGVPMVIMEPIKGGSLATIPADIIKPFTDVTPGASPASIALRWVASLPNVKVILSGMSSMEQVEQNLSTFAEPAPLSDAEQNAVSAIRDALGKRVHNNCTGCRYCMPCPAGVDIPFNFHIWNQLGVYENKGEANWFWTHEIAESAKAFNCKECGLCEEKCPQKISIRQDLKKVSEAMKEISKAN